MTPAATELLASKSAFRRSLLAWYRANARALPWRAQPTLYKTAVSELMLQQTQIKTALPYFERWMRELPDFAALAAAPESRVLKLWEGLGYYTRARNLHKLARALVAMPEPPRTPDAWRELPGIGPYTAAAITSITYGQPAACVDGNVVRILSRLTADATEHRDSSAAAKYFAPLANALINPRFPGDHNQAMMELGATLCTRAAPDCARCPVRAHCAARLPSLECGGRGSEATGDTAFSDLRIGTAHESGVAAPLCRRTPRKSAPTPENFPRFAPKKYEAQTHTRIWLVRTDTNSKTKPETQTQSLLLHRAAPTARRLAGIHELPAPEHLALKASGLTLQAAPLIATQNRSITRYRITEKVHALALTPAIERAIRKSNSRAAQDPLPLQWHPLRDIDRITLSGPHRRLVRKILDFEGKPHPHTSVFTSVSRSPGSKSIGAISGIV